MKFLSILLIHCLNCTHYVPIFYGHTWELIECKKYKRHAEICMDKGKCGKEGRHFLLRKVSNESGISMELDCM